MRRKICFFLLLLCLLACLLASCAGEPIGTAQILEELCALDGALPDGVQYRSGVGEGSEGYLSPELMRQLYGADAEEIFAALEEYAIYLSSFAMPYEIAVFRCYSATDANAVAAMCLVRSDWIRVGLNGTELESLSDSLRVTCRGRYVVMSLTSDPDATQKTTLRLIR